MEISSVMAIVLDVNIVMLNMNGNNTNFWLHSHSPIKWYWSTILYKTIKLIFKIYHILLSFQFRHLIKDHYWQILFIMSNHLEGEASLESLTISSDMFSRSCCRWRFFNRVSSSIFCMLDTWSKWMQWMCELIMNLAHLLLVRHFLAVQMYQLV